MSDQVAIRETSDLVVTDEQERRIGELIDELTARQAEAERNVIEFWHFVGSRLVGEIQPDMDGPRISCGPYGEFVIRRVAEALGYERTAIYLAMHLFRSFPQIVERRSTISRTGELTTRPWSYRDLLLVLPLNDAQRAEAVDWYSHPWQEGDWVIPPSKVYPGQRAPMNIWGTNKTREDLKNYVQFLKSPKKALKAEPAPSVIAEARRAATTFVRYVERAPAVTLGRLPVALAKLDPEKMADEDREQVRAALDAIDVKIDELRERLADDHMEV